MKRVQLKRWNLTTLTPQPLQLHFEVGNEKGTTEEIEFDNLDTTTQNFIFPNLEVGHRK